MAQGWGRWCHRLKHRNKTTQMVEFRVGYDVHLYVQSANIPLQGLDRCVLTVGALSDIPAKLEPSTGTISPVVSLPGLQTALWKTDQLTLASEGSEHA